MKLWFVWRAHHPPSQSTHLGGSEHDQGWFHHELQRHGLSPLRDWNKGKSTSGLTCQTIMEDSAWPKEKNVYYGIARHILGNFGCYSILNQYTREMSQISRIHLLTALYCSLRHSCRASAPLTTSGIVFAPQQSHPLRYVVPWHTRASWSLLWHICDQKGSYINNT